MADDAQTPRTVSAPHVGLVDVDGCNVRVMRGGSGPALLFLHGGRGAGEWLGFFAHLAESFDVIVPEHPGFGGSDQPAWLCTVGDLARFYQKFLGRLQISNVHLVGTSLGGWIAAELAALDGRPFCALTLIAAAGLQAPGVAAEDLFQMTPQEMLQRSYADPERVQRLLAMPPDPHEIARQQKNRGTLELLGRANRMTDPTLRDRLQGISVPTMLIWGEQDGIIKPQVGEAYRDAIPGATLHVLGGCAHLPHVESMHDTAALVLEHHRRATR